jgi:PAS domain S-box-containing protein
MILLIDNYDSFVFNLARYLERLGQRTCVVRNTANHAWLAMTGYTAEEIRSKPLHDLVHHHYPDGRPYPMDECPLDRALPENFDLRAHADLFFRKDGTPFPVLCAASPIFEDGRPVATVVEIRDVTDQKRAGVRPTTNPLSYPNKSFGSSGRRA